MKNFILLLALFFGIHTLDAKPEKTPKKELTEAQQLRVAEMENRLAEIKAMDFRSMSKAEVKEIKGELKEMKAEARASGNGIYFSAAAIIIIILLLILLL